MERKLERGIQEFFGNRVRINEVDLRPITDGLGTLGGKLAFPFRLAGLVYSELRYELWRRTAGREARLEKPVLMYGMPHSGTSVAMRLFASHPDVANLSEANTILQPLGYFDWQNGETVRTAAEATPQEIRRLHQRFEFQRQRKNKALFINKSPMNSVRLDFLNAVFPDAYFIHIIRDGRAVINSLVNEHPEDQVNLHNRRPVVQRHNPFPGPKPANWRSLLRDDIIEQFALQWVEVVGFALEEEKRLGLNVIHLRYEDLAANNRASMVKLFEFTGLRADEESVGHLREKVDNRNYKWKEKLSSETVKMITEIQGPVLRGLGYEV